MLRGRMSRDPDSDGALAATALDTDRGQRLGLTITAAPGRADRRPGSPSAASAGPGDVIGRFEIEACIGRGGMGEVFSARDPALQRTVALKLLRTEASGGVATVGRRKRLLREARAMARLEHPNVLTVYEVGNVDGRDYIAMAYVDGESLDVWLDSRTRGWAEVLGVFLEAARGLQAAHRAGLIHRDFKPSNVLVGRDGRVHVTDFGLARMDDGRASVRVEDPDQPSSDPTEQGDEPARRGRPLAPSLTQTGALLGTPLFMAPEQHRGDTTDARTDQYSYCASLYQGLYGVAPFAGADLDALHRAKERQQLVDSSAAPTLPGHIRQALTRGMSVDRDERFPSMDELIQALSPRRSRRTRVLGLGLAAALGLALASSLYWCLRPPPPAATDTPIAVADPYTARRVDAIRAELQALIRAPRTGDLDTHLLALSKRADELEFAPLRAEILLARAEVACIAARVKLARELLDRALLLAQELGYHELHTRAAVAAAEWQDWFSSDRDKVEQAVERAEALLQRHAGPASLGARLDLVRANGLLSADEYARAEELARAARDVFLAADDDLRAGHAAHRMASSMLAAGALERALEQFEQSCNLSRRSQGARHPTMIDPCSIETHLLSLLGRHDQALRRVLEDATWLAEPTARRAFLSSYGTVPEAATRTLRGRVVDSAGAPVAGAQVAAGLNLTSGSHHLIERMSVMNQLSFDSFVTVTDEQGRFEIAEIPVRARLVSAELAGVGRARTLVLDADQTTVELVLAKVGRIRGQLANAHADPAARSVILLDSSLPIPGSVHRYIALVAADGSFEIDNLAPGTYRFYITDHKQRTMNAAARGPLTLASGERVEVALAARARKALVTATIEVRSRLGMPVPAALVVVLPPGLQATRVSELQRHALGALGQVWESAKTAAAAGSDSVEVEFRDVTPGPHTLCVLVLPADFLDPAVQLELKAELPDLATACQQVEISAERLTIEL